MDTSSEFQTVLQKHKQNIPVTTREIAVAIANDEDTLLQFIADNDWIQAYGLIHRSDAAMQIGRGAKFVPNKARVEGELKSLEAKKDFSTLNDIINAFRINTATPGYTSNAQILASLSDIEAISMTPTGYRFNLTFG